MIIPDTIYNTVKLYPDKKAIVCSGNSFTYGQFKKRVDSLASALHEANIRKGDRVAILHSNCHVFLELYYATAQVGAVLVPLNTRLSPSELAYMIKDSQTGMLFCQHQLREKILPMGEETSSLEKIIWSRAPSDFSPEKPDITYEHFLDSAQHPGYEEEDIDPEDIAQIYYTSGSTGRPKGVIMTHKNMATHALGTLYEYQVTDNDVWLHGAPLFHIADACNTWAITWAGGRHIIIDKFKPEQIPAIIESEKITMVKLVPTMWNMLLNTPEVNQYDYGHLRLVISGGAPIAPELVRKIMATFKCEYIQNYGMTETTHFLTISRLKENLKRLPQAEQIAYRAKIGRPFLGVKIRVVDEQGQDVIPDGKQVGEIIVKGDIITPGYWRLPEENAQAFKNGWLHTGDLANIDKEGYLGIVDRKKDMVVTGGENVFSLEVENVFYMHPGIREAAVLGVPHPKWGEAVKAVCVLKEEASASEEELILFCREHIAHYKAPKSVDFVEVLPKTGSGKIDKKTLKKKYWQGFGRSIG